jgi:uroporphyrinogen-III decarboxylase
MPHEVSLQRPQDWPELTPLEKRQWRFERWRRSAKDVAFVSAEAQTGYEARLERLIAVYNLEEPDRVPVASAAGMLPLREAGLDYHTSAYEPDKAVAAYQAFNHKHAEELDSFASSGFTAIPARALDLLGLGVYAFPGRGMPRDGVGFQFVEDEYMRADEYDLLIRDPSDFWLRTYFPRAYSIFEPLRRVPPLPSIIEIHSLPLWPLARPEIQTLLQQLLDAGKELTRYLGITTAERVQAAANGYPVVPPAGLATAPFDTLGDTLRGTRGILTDMFRRPDKLLEALNVMAELTIDSLLGGPLAQTGLRVFFPLHKGADGWMSEEQFLTFYWPTLKKVMDALIAEGLVCHLFAEGSFNTRLDLVNDFPKGAVTWRFDRSDMAKVKRVLGPRCAIEGNIPTSLLVAGSATEVKAACRMLIEVCAPGGGYILGSGATPEFPRLENLKAMAHAAREYGVYGH